MMIATETTPSAGHPDVDAPTLDLRRLFIQSLLVLFAVAVVMGSIAWALKDTFFGLSRYAVELLGGWGVALGFWATDALTLPLPNDVFSTVGLSGGLSFWAVVAWGSAGSIIGGAMAWAFGRWFAETETYERWIVARGVKMTRLVERYGMVALAAAAMTPLPYSVACYACGAGGMSLGSWTFVSLLRPVRIALYLGAIQLGIVTIAG